MLSLITLFRNEPPLTWIKLLLLAVISGASNAAVLALVNYAISHMNDPQAGATALVGFFVTIAIFAAAQRYLFIGASELAQRAVHGVRARFVDKLQSIELREMEGLSRAEIHACLNAELQTISEAAISLTILGQAVLVMIAVYCYLAWLTPAGFAIAVGFIIIAVLVNFRQTQKIDEAHQAAFATEAQVLAGYTDLLEGFKELKLNAAKAEDLSATIRRTSRKLSRQRLGLHTLFAGNLVTSETLFFLFVAVIVFGLPLVGRADPTTVALTAASALFLLGPISGVVGGFPVLQRINAAAKTLLLVEERISRLDQSKSDSPPAPSDFQSISLRGATFCYAVEDGEFTVGPIDLDIERGDVLFITGGNGSGKSTLLKVLTGLYPPTNGVLQLDGRSVTAGHSAPYRSLFSAIFSDNHLFKVLYGIPHPDPREVSELLHLMEMAKKTRIVGNAFESIALSSGQRKRLALIAALLEHRPVCVLDEWAADQDPHFREKFYRVILPYLKQLGKTVIAVTHDERYFDAADARIHLVEGKMQVLARPAGYPR
jgi:putative ATP-binding cassette transporter